MTISLTDAGKRFNRDWIFRHFSHEFITGRSYAITGPNGSGKSTLLQVIAGAIHLSEGELGYQPPQSGRMLKGAEADQLFRYIAIAAPYLELVEEMTLREFLAFHSTFKPFLKGLSFQEIASRVGLEAALDKQIRYYSSGMKQRAKLAQAIFSDVPCIMLDEPCTNLDAAGVAVYQALIEEYRSERMLIVSSNDTNEYGFCDEMLNIVDFKPGARHSTT